MQRTRVAKAVFEISDATQSPGVGVGFSGTQGQRRFFLVAGRHGYYTYR